MADPRHVAIVMDGNGRWAQARGLPRTAGHAAGEEALFDVVHGALGLGIEWLTVFTFSTENWKRPIGEVTEYHPSFVEWLMTLGIWAFGFFILTILLKGAIGILQGEIKYVAAK